MSYNNSTVKKGLTRYLNCVRIGFRLPEKKTSLTVRVRFYIYLYVLCVLNTFNVRFIYLMSKIDLSKLLLVITSWLYWLKFWMMLLSVLSHFYLFIWLLYFIWIRIHLLIKKCFYGLFTSPFSYQESCLPLSC